MCTNAYSIEALFSFIVLFLKDTPPVLKTELDTPIVPFSTAQFSFFILFISKNTHHSFEKKKRNI